MGCPWNLSTFVNSLVYTVYNLLRGRQKTTTWRDCNRPTSYLCFHGYPSNNTSRFLHWRSPQHLGVTVSAACPQHKRPSRETSASPFLPEAWACEGRFVGRSNGPNPQEILKLTAKGAKNRVGPKRKGLVSQWWFFGGYVSFSECRWRLFFLNTDTWRRDSHLRINFFQRSWNQQLQKQLFPVFLAKDLFVIP